MKKITMWYNWRPDLAWTVCVNIAGEALAGFLWWRIAPLSDSTLNSIILSVFLGYTGVALICILRKYQKKSKLFARLNIGERIFAIDYKGHILEDVKEWKIEYNILQGILGICTLSLRDIKGKKMQIKNVPIEIEKYL